MTSADDAEAVSLLIELPDNTHKRLLEYLEMKENRHETQDTVIRKALNTYLPNKQTKAQNEYAKKYFNRNRPFKPIKNLNVHRYDSNAEIHQARMETFKQLLDSIASDVARTEQRFINTDEDLERIKDLLVDYFERALMKSLSRA